MSQSGEIRKDRSACAASGSPTPPGRSDSEVWDLAPVRPRARNSHSSPCPVLAQATGRAAHRWFEEKVFWGSRVSSFTRTYWTFTYKCQPQSQRSHRPRERGSRLPLPPWFGSAGKPCSVHASERRGSEVWGGCTHPASLGSFGPVPREGQRPFRPPGRLEAGAGPGPEVWASPQAAHRGARRWRWKRARRSAALERGGRAALQGPRLLSFD